MPAEPGQPVFGLNEQQRQDLDLSGYKGCATALRSEACVIAAGLRQSARARTGDWRLPSAMRETVTTVPDKDRASLPGRDAAHASAGESALPRRFPGSPASRKAMASASHPRRSPDAVVGDPSGQLACHVGWNSRLGRALIMARFAGPDRLADLSHVVLPRAQWRLRPRLPAGRFQAWPGEISPSSRRPDDPAQRGPTSQ